MSRLMLRIGTPCQKIYANVIELSPLEKLQLRFFLDGTLPLQNFTLSTHPSPPIVLGDARIPVPSYTFFGAAAI